MNTSQPPADRSTGKPPVLLTPPGGEAPPGANHFLLFSLCVTGLLLLLLLAAAVVWYLPRHGEQAAGVVRSGPAVKSNQAGTAGPIDPGAAEAERLLGEWLRRQAVAEGENVSAWGGDAYAAILDTAAKADLLMRQKRFTEAQAVYQQVAAELEHLLGARNDLLQQALAQGGQALDRLESEAARQAFARALAIDPVNEEAQRGARRAQNLDRVLALYQEALRRERENYLAGAAGLLRQALDLDSEFTRATEALADIEERLREREYREAMSSALAALERREPAAAEKALDRALLLRPDDEAAADASRRLAQLKKTIQLEELRQKAGTAAAAEKWSEALDLYARALAIDPHAAFAATGKAEAGRRLRLDQSIREALAAPARLQEDGPLREAKQILAGAEIIPAPGPVLSSQIAELSRLLDTAAMKIEVLLRSDNMTLVEIYHIGRFQPFREMRLALRPGSYTVVGRRPGFRDVRRTLTVTADQAGSVAVLTVRCEEPI